MTSRQIDSAEEYSIEQLMESSGVKFGTSGARGLAVSMTDQLCYVYTVAFLQYLEGEGRLPPVSEVAIAGDLRPSTPRICAAVARAVTDKGYTLVYCGEIPSPAVAGFGFSRGIPSVMVTGSHIPDDRNGIKYNTPSGEVLKRDEQGIRAQSVRVPGGLFGADGALREPYPLPEVGAEAEQQYMRRYTDFFGPTLLRGLRLGFYQHSCVGRDTLPAIYRALGATVTSLGRSEQFIPVDTEAIRPEDSALAAQWAAGGEFDAILSADGDCDRPLIADERGSWLRGDVAGVLCAQFLGAREVATPVSCNSVVEQCGAFRRVIRTRIGSPYVIAAMDQASAEADGVVVGYEANGGFLTNSEIEREGRQLASLPTRDAAIVHIALLAKARGEGLSLTGLVATLPQRYTASDRLVDFPSERAQQILAGFTGGDAAVAADRIEAAFGHLCGPVSAVDTTDGLRASFDNREVIHLRPSGNAPELRIYNEAASEARVRELNSACLDIMAGWR